MSKEVGKKIFLLLISFTISIILAIYISEYLFLKKNGDWYRNKSFLLQSQRLIEAYPYVNTEKCYTDVILKPFPEEYRPVILENIAGNFNPSILQNKEIITENLKEGYDIVVSLWVKCVEPKMLKIYLESNKKAESYLFQDKGIVKDGYDFLFVTTSFNGKAKITIENKQQIISCKDLKIFLKRHPFTDQYKKDGNSYRILVVGGSTSAAYGIKENETYSFFAQKYFDALQPGRVDVINFAVPGSIVNQYIGRLGFYFLVKPDMVIIAPCWNDAHANVSEKFILSKKFFGNITYYDIIKFTRNNKFFTTYALGYYLYKNFTDRLSKETLAWFREYSKLDHLTQHTEALEAFKNGKENLLGGDKKRLKYLVDALASKGIKVILFTLPSISTGVEPTPEERETLTKAMYAGKLTCGGGPKDFFVLMKLMDLFHLADKDVITSVADETKATLIRCENDPLFKNAPYSIREDFFWDYVHPNPKGSELIGNVLGNEVYKLIKDKTKYN